MTKILASRFDSRRLVYAINLTACAVAFLIASFAVNASDRIISNRLFSNDHIVGQASLQVLFWNVFDATLRAPNGEYNPDKPFALTLSYRRKIDSDKLVNSSIAEMESHPASTSRSLTRT